MAQITGAILNQLASYTPLTALCPATNMRAFEIPPDYLDPPGVAVVDKVKKTDWWSDSEYYEAHELTATCFGIQAATVGAPDPVNLIGIQVEAAIDWTNLGIEDTLTIGLKRCQWSMMTETKRNVGAQRVFKVTLQWLVNLSVG